LGVIGDGQAVPALLSTLQDPKAEVRRAAQKALQQIEAKGLTSS
jgi:HEAT repeat protein